MAKLDEYITQKVRAKHAVVRTGGKDKYPIFDAKSAASALRLIGMAKPPLTSSQEADVRSRAAKYLGKPKAPGQ